MKNKMEKKWPLNVDPNLSAKQVIKMRLDREQLEWQRKYPKYAEACRRIGRFI